MTSSSSPAAPRDFPAEFAAFLRRHKLDIAIDEVLHLDTLPTTEEEIRQHNHVVVRAPRSRLQLSLCLTAQNWDNFPIRDVDVLMALAADAAILEGAHGDFLAWADSLEWNPDSRAAERKFRRTLHLVTTLRNILGDAAFDELMTLYGAMALAWAAETGALDAGNDEDEGEEDIEEDDGRTPYGRAP